MIINVVKNKSGKTVGSFEAASAGGATITPVLEDGAKAEEMEVAANYKQDLAALYKA